MMDERRCRIGVGCPWGHGHPVKPGVTKLRLGVLTTSRHARLDRASMAGERRAQFLVCLSWAGKSFCAHNAQLGQAQPLRTDQYGYRSFVFGFGVRADVQLRLGL